MNNKIIKIDIKTMRIIIYLAVAVSTAIALVLGIFFFFNLEDKLFIIGPAFLIVLLVMFYGLVIEPKTFTPTKIKRYATRPKAVEELSRFLRTSNLLLVGERLYRVFRKTLCYKLDLQENSDDANILEIIRLKHSELENEVTEALDRYREFVGGTKKIMNEKEFIIEYKKLLNILYSFDGKILKK